MPKSRKVIFSTLLALFAVMVGIGLSYTLGTPKKPAPQVINTPTAEPQALNTVSYEGKDGVSALELLKTKAEVKTKSSASLGEFVESINGEDGGGKKYWLYYVNGQQAQVGADKYITKSGEQIEWRLE